MQKRVLFIDEENGIEELKRRIDLLIKGSYSEHRQSIKDNLFFTSYAGICLDDPKKIEVLKEKIKEFKPNVIVVDGWRRVVHGDENDSETINSIFQNTLIPLKEQYNLTWVFLHHLRKGLGRGFTDRMDEVRGSSDLVNFTDVVFLLERRKHEVDTFVLEHNKARRGKEITPKLIQVTDNSESIILTCIDDAKAIVYADQQYADKIRNWLIKDKISAFRTKEAKEALEIQKKDERTLYRALKSLRTGKEPTIKSITRGHYEVVQHVK